MAFEVDRAREAARPGRTARGPPRRTRAGSRSPATSAAGGPRSTRSRPQATTCSRGRRRRPASVAPAPRLRPISAGDEHAGSGAGLRALPPRRARARDRASMPACACFRPTAARRCSRSMHSRGGSTTSPTASSPTAEKLAGLESVRARLQSPGDSDDPVFVAIADAARRFPIPLDAFDDLVDGAETDVRGDDLRDVRRPRALLPLRRRARSGGCRSASSTAPIASPGPGSPTIWALPSRSATSSVTSREDAAAGRVYLPRRGSRAVRRARQPEAASAGRWSS